MSSICSDLCVVFYASFPHARHNQSKAYISKAVSLVGSGVYLNCLEKICRLDEKKAMLCILEKQLCLVC